MPEAPAAPPAGAPQEAATPVEALAAEWDDDAHAAAQQGASPFLEVAYAVRTCAEDVRQRLAPAWDALAAERDKARREYDKLVSTAARYATVEADLEVAEAFAAQYGRERDALNAQCEDAHAENARLIRRMKELADHWQREYASETGWPSRCAIELREALEAPDA